ncbi:aminopeptidase N-like [Ceratina calcarata]|uniref:Aminopeptidase n=1 Tax=Ceratina calcarata TaxID=156304 RepID=A0AAJ7S942_9HYME|nr:aminopeptidase N-like [Ceratina calcarata]
MTCTKVLAVLALMCVVTRALPVPDDTGDSIKAKEMKYRLPNTTAPIHYDLKFDPNLVDTFTFDGEAVIKFKVLEPTSDVKLHSQRLNLNESSIELTPENGNTIKPQWCDENNETDIVTIHFDKPLEVGVYTLSIKFCGNLSTQMFGFFKDKYKNEQGEEVWLAATQFEPVSARNAFPCWDEPALKATFNISMKHLPNCTAISNMPIREKSEVDESDGKIWSHFETTPVMSTYLVAFVVADFGNVSSDDGKIRAWSRRQVVPYLKFGLEIAQRAAKELEEYTNSTVRVPKMDHVVQPSHASGAMENWGIITYPESSFVYKEGETPASHKLSIIETIVHEVAHQWFGNVVSPTWWTHLWLNEGFASFFHHYIMDKLFPTWRMKDYFVTHVVQGSLSTDTKWHTFSVDAEVLTPDEVENAFSQAVYNKAPAILYMLTNIITPEVYQAGLISYLNEHEYSSANSDSLFEALQKALDASTVPHDGYKIKEVMDTWIKQRRYPLVSVIRDKASGKITLSQADFAQIDQHMHSDDNDEYKDENVQHQWWVPVTYATETNPDFSNTVPTHWLKPNENLTIDGINPDDWIVVNKLQAGYYRVIYDNDNWNKIAACLNSENFTNIHVLSRTAIISDATELVGYDLMKPMTFINIASYLSQETDFVPWYPMFRFLNRIWRKISIPSAALLKVTLLFLNAIESIFKDVDYEELKDDGILTIFKRSEVLKWACNLGNMECREKATEQFMEYLDNPDKKISPNLKSWLFRNALRSANESVWNKTFETLKTNDIRPHIGSYWSQAFQNYVQGRWGRIIYALSRTENPELFARYLQEAVSENGTLPEEVQSLMINYILFDNEGSSHIDVLIDYVIEHWDEIHADIKKLKAVAEAKSDDKEATTKFWQKRLKEIQDNEDDVKRWTDAIEEGLWRS